MQRCGRAARRGGHGYRDQAMRAIGAALVCALHFCHRQLSVAFIALRSMWCSSGQPQQFQGCWYRDATVYDAGFDVELSKTAEFNRELECGRMRSSLPPCSLGLRDLHTAHIRLVQPSVRTAGSKPAILEGPGTRRTEAEGKPHYVLQTSQNTWNRRKRPRKI